MKQLSTTIFIICLCYQLNAQNLQPQLNVIRQTINAEKYIGKNFELKASIKCKTISNNSGVWLFAVCEDKKGNKKTKDFIYSEMAAKDNWRTYICKGVIKPDAYLFKFGNFIQNRCIAFVDDFKLLIDGKEIPIKDFSLEDDSTLTKKNWEFSLLAENTTAFISTEKYVTGKKALKIDASKVFHKNEIGDNDSIGRYVNVNGINIYYEEYGSGEPLLLLHGNSESIAGFTMQIPELSKNFKVIAVDTRGQGKSGDDGKLYTYDLFAEDMNALLNELKLDSVNVLGWSDGGNTGLIMAIKYPKKVKRLLTIGANIFIDKTAVEKIVFKEMDKLDAQLKYDSTDFGLNQKRLLNLLRTEPKMTFNNLNNITCPVLVMAGEKDLISKAHTEGIAQNIKKSKLMIVKNETHEFPRENATKFNQLVLNWFDLNSK